MAKKEILDKLSIYVPHSKQAEKPVERLIRLGEKAGSVDQLPGRGGDSGVSQEGREEGVGSTVPF